MPPKDPLIEVCFKLRTSAIAGRVRADYDRQDSQVGEIGDPNGETDDSDEAKF